MGTKLRGKPLELSDTCADPLVHLSVAGAGPRALARSVHRSTVSLEVRLHGRPRGTGMERRTVDSLETSADLYCPSFSRSWSGTANQVKSYTNVGTSFTKKQLSGYSSIPTTWQWNYTGTSLRVNGMYRHLLLSAV
jgi:hypothetical protein